jgi:two-component system, chemotaxis family, response regulator Rcp1
VDVLLVEDNPADAYIIQQVLGDVRTDLRLWVVPDGPEVLQFLRNASPITHVPPPILILLDLKLPTTDGTLLLPQIRQLPGYQATPIVIVTGVPWEREGTRCLQLGANAYIQKTANFYAFCDAIREIAQRWLR